MLCTTYSGEYCAFPFKYNGKTYDHCTNDDSAVGRYWCATKVDSDGNCEDDCTDVYGNDWSWCKIVPKITFDRCNKLANP